MERSSVISTGQAQTLLEVAPVTLPLFPSYREIRLTQGKVALVDIEDYERVSSFAWNAYYDRHVWYGRRTIRWRDGDIKKQATVLLHRFIMGLDAGDCRVVDHINGNGLDNRKTNLRVCTNAENCRNSRLREHTERGMRGVMPLPSGNWGAQIGVNYRKIFLGTFPSKEEAHNAYCKAAVKYHGKFRSRALDNALIDERLDSMPADEVTA